MHELDKLFTPYKLKEVERTGFVKERHESTAEHIYSTIALAEYFLKKVKGLDEVKVLKLILYHDFGEIKVGDTFILDDKNRITKEGREDAAVKSLEKEVPKEISEELKKSWTEYKENKTREAKFARAVDALDPIIHVIYQPEEWKKHNFTEKKLRAYKEPFMKEFPEVLKFFNEMIEELKKRKIIPEEKN